MEEDPEPKIVTTRDVDVKKTIARDDDVEKPTARDDNIEKESGTEVRKSTRKRVQRMIIEADDIGDCDTTNDPDYRG